MLLPCTMANGISACLGECESGGRASSVSTAVTLSFAVALALGSVTGLFGLIANSINAAYLDGINAKTRNNVRNNYHFITRFQAVIAFKNFKCSHQGFFWIA